MAKKKTTAWLLAVVLVLALLPCPGLAVPSSDYVLTGNGADDVVSVARAQVGKTRGDFGYTYEWCASFVCWAGRTAGQNFPNPDLLNPKDIAQWFVNTGAGTFYGFRDQTYNSLVQAGLNPGAQAIRTDRQSVVPQKGDLICFLWQYDIEEGYNWSHIAVLAEDYDGSTLRTIDANASPIGQTWGDDQRTVLVQQRSYGPAVVGIIRPNYGSGSNQAAPGRTVNYYVEQYGGGYELADTDQLTAAAGMPAVEELLSTLRTYENCQQPDLLEIMKALQSEDTVDLYYPRLYQLTLVAGDGVTQLYGGGAYLAGTEVTITAKTAPHYELSWPQSGGAAENGGWAFTMPPQDTLLVFSAAQPPHVGSFWDVPLDAWYAKSVERAVELGLMKGTSAEAFSPQKGVTLAETVVLAARLYSGQAGDEAEFTAQPGEPWYAPYVAYAMEHGLVTEDRDWTAGATRGEFARILGRALPEEALEALWEEQTFADLDSEAANEEILLLCRAGVMSGENRGGALYFNPERAISRAEAAAVTARMADPALRLRPAA